MVGRIESSDDGRSGYGEEKTNDLRIRNGMLQQKFLITTLGPGQPLQVTEEWRNIPEEDDKE